MRAKHYAICVLCLVGISVAAFFAQGLPPRGATPTGDPGRAARSPVVDKVAPAQPNQVEGPDQAAETTTKPNITSKDSSHVGEIVTRTMVLPPSPEAQPLAPLGIVVPQTTIPGGEATVGGAPAAAMAVVDSHREREVNELQEQITSLTKELEAERVKRQAIEIDNIKNATRARVAEQSHRNAQTRLLATESELQILKSSVFGSNTSTVQAIEARLAEVRRNTTNISP